MKVLHQVWIQGENELPEAYRGNRERWRQALPCDWEMILWNRNSASERWPEYARIAEKCSHYAMEADIILALALRDIGGVATGTDVVPVNLADFLAFIEVTDTMIVTNPMIGSCSNGLVWMKNPGHPLMDCVCRHQLRDDALLGDKNVWKVTGPRAWWEAVKARMWDLTMVTDRKAYTRCYGEKGTQSATAWVDPGYAGSWH